ncbi:unnamed protein product [Candidula unifasciata]|uniref:Uncharacterized protein n=1 Tax=Candidula unifasciata TaxID=100452 RepID=A0A8S3Z0P1_9EUPU|nr:unnamed protein product [Candidula unifasciata]
MAIILRTASVWLKGAIISFAIGLLLFVIGFATTSWVVYHHRGLRNDYQNNGLWQSYVCRNNQHCTTYSLYYLNDYHRAIQAMECLGLIGYIISLVILLLYLCADSCRRRDFLQATTAITFAGILFACIGFALFGSHSNQENIQGVNGNIGWSMGIAIAGTVLYGLGGIFLIVQLIR